MNGYTSYETLIESFHGVMPAVPCALFPSTPLYILVIYALFPEETSAVYVKTYKMGFCLIYAYCNSKLLAVGRR